MSSSATVDTASTPIAATAWKRLAACVAAAALLQIDGTVITVALPSLESELGVGSHTVAWALTAYFISYALALYPGGKLTDRYGSRHLALGGLALFGLGAALGAIADTFEVVVVSRIVQGIGAGLVSPASLAGAVSGFPPERRGSALGIWGAGSGMANVLGPLIGGLLVDIGGWRACWWALVPMAVGGMVAVYLNVPAAVHEDEAPDVSYLRQRVVTAAATVAAITFVVMIGTFFLAQQYLQEVKGYSGLAAGATLIVVAVMVVVAAPIAGRICDRRGERLPALVGFLLAGVGLILFSVPGSALTGFAALPALILVGAGLGFLFSPASRAALNAVPLARHGSVSSMLSAARLLGAATGSSLAGVALANGVTAGHVRSALLVAGAICLSLGLLAASQLTRPDSIRTH